MRAILLVGFVAAATPALAANFAECLLDKMPDAQNYPAAVAIMQVCGQKYPGGYQVIPQGSNRGHWFGLAGFESGAECAVKKASGTTNNQAGAVIRVACNCLYDAAFVSGESCSDKMNRKSSFD